MKFTKRTYRRARALAFKELAEAKDLTRRAEFGTVEDDLAADYYLAALKKAVAIVQRGRRERRLWLIGY